MRAIIKCDDLTYADLLQREISRVAAGIAAGVCKKLKPYLEPFKAAMEGKNPPV
jgi:hypothetical protein